MAENTDNTDNISTYYENIEKVNRDHKADKSISLTGPIVTIIHLPADHNKETRYNENCKLLVVYSGKECYHSSRYTYHHLSTIRQGGTIIKAADKQSLRVVKEGLSITLCRV